MDCRLSFGYGVENTLFEILIECYNATVENIFLS